MKKVFICMVILEGIFGLYAAGQCAEAEGVLSTVESDIQIIIDGDKLETEDAPVIINDRTYLPVRAIAEGMGAEVDYTEKDNAVRISSNNTDYPGDDWEQDYYIGEDGLPYTCFKDREGNIRIKTNYIAPPWVAFDVRENEEKYLNNEEEYIKYEEEVWDKLDNQVTFSIFNDGYIIMRKTIDGKKRYGVMDIWGNEIIFDEKYQTVETFGEGLTAASTKRKTSSVGVETGFINLAGEMVIPEKYLAVMRFSEGVCAVSEEGYLSMNWYFIDHSGNRVFGDKTYILAGMFNNGYCPVQTKGVPMAPPKGNVEKFSYIDHTGELATDKEWDYAYNFDGSGYAVVKEGEQWMRIDKNFDVVEYLDEDGNPIAK